MGISFNRNMLFGSKRLATRRNAITPAESFGAIEIARQLSKSSNTHRLDNFICRILNTFDRSVIFAAILFVLIPILCIQPAYSLQCVQCSTELDEFCKCNPPAPKECPIKEYDHCVTVKEKSRGKIMAFTRSCSPEDLGNNVCIKGRTPEGEPKEICYTSCTSDGCNKEDLLIDCEPGVKLSEEAQKKMEELKNKIKGGAVGVKDKIGDAAHKAGDKIDEKLDNVGKAISAGLSSFDLRSSLNGLAFAIAIITIINTMWYR